MACVIVTFNSIIDFKKYLQLCFLYFTKDIKENSIFFSKKVRRVIRDEIGDAKYCIIIDEARDESRKE